MYVCLCEWVWERERVTQRRETEETKVVIYTQRCNVHMLVGFFWLNTLVYSSVFRTNICFYFKCRGLNENEIPLLAGSHPPYFYNTQYMYNLKINYIYTYITYVIYTIYLYDIILVSSLIPTLCNIKFVWTGLLFVWNKMLKKLLISYSILNTLQNERNQLHPKVTLFLIFSVLTNIGSSSLLTYYDYCLHRIISIWSL